MKRILIFGKLNEVMKDVERALSEYFRIQICDIRSDSVNGMLLVYEPDLVIISLVGAADYDTSVFRIMALQHRNIPVLTIGTEREKEAFLRFYSDRQFENLIRPVDNELILQTACRRLRLTITRHNGHVMITDPYGRKNVLVVDDNPVMLRGIKEMLDEDFDVTVASSGIQALTAIGKRRPDLILLDYEMPVCDGKMTLEMIRADEDLNNMQVIFLTGYSDRAHIEAVLSLKPSGYLLKPVARDELISAIRTRICW